MIILRNLKIIKVNFKISKIKIPFFSIFNIYKKSNIKTQYYFTENDY